MDSRRHRPLGPLRVSLAGCVMTQTMVAIGASFGLAGLHAAAGNAGAGLARALADVPGLRCADHLVHRDRGAGAAAGRAVPALGVHRGLAVGRSARPGAVHARPARRLRGGRDHRRARPAHHRHLDPRPGRHPAAIAAGNRPGHLRNRRVGKGTEGRAVISLTTHHPARTLPTPGPTVAITSTDGADEGSKPWTRSA